MKSPFANGLYAAYDLGTSSVKAVVIKKHGETLQIVAVESEPMKAQTDFPGDTEFRDHQAQTLKILATRLPLGEILQHVCLFNCRDLQVKIIDFPNDIPTPQLEGALEWEAKKLLAQPLRHEPFLFTYHPVKENGKSFALAVIPQIRLQRMTEMFSLAGIPLSGAYPEVFAAQAIKEALPPSSLPAVSFINLGHANTHIEIFHRGELRFYRHIPAGFRELQEGGGKPIPAAPHQGNAVPAPGGPSETFETFAQKIRFSFDYFRASSKLTHVDDIVFLGGGSGVEDFIQFAAEYFSPGSVRTLDLSVAFDLSGFLPQIGQRSPLAAATPALAAFLAHLSPRADHMNFQGKWQRILDREKRQKISELLPVLGGVIGILLALILTFTQKAALESAKTDLYQQISIAGHEVASWRLKLAQMQVTATATNLSAQDKKILRPLLLDRLSGGELLFHLGVNRPEGMTIDSVKVHAGADFSVDEEEKDEPVIPVEPGPEPAQDSDPFKIIDPQENGVAETGAAPEPALAVVEETTPIDSPQDLRERFVIIRGSCSTYAGLLDYVRTVKEKGAIRQYRLFHGDVAGTQKVRFTVVGELP